MRRVALVLIVLLGALALARGLTGQLDPYDAYEVRASARAIAGDPALPFAIYRSALLTLLEVPTELWARGSRAAWVWPHLVGVASYVGLALATALLGRRSGLAPWAAWLAAIAVALDRVAFHDAPLGLPDALATCLATLGLAGALPGEKRSYLGPAVLLGLAAAARPNAGLAAVALVVGSVREPRKELGRVVAIAAAAFGTYLLIETLFFALGRGSLAAGLAGHVELARFQREQFAENAQKYGSTHPPIVVYLASLPRLEPLTALLAPFGLAVALLRPTRARATLAVAVLAHAFFLVRLVGHGEARYLLPVLPPLAVLGASALEHAWPAPPRKMQAAIAAAWVAIPLGMAARFEHARTTDALATSGFSQRVAAQVAAIESTSGRVFWTPDLPFPVYPRALPGNAPFPGDPFHGIAHAGPVTVTYHLGRPVTLLQRVAPGGRALPGIASEADLPQLAPMLRDGDVVILGAPEPGLTWTIREPPPSVRIYLFRGGAFGRVSEVSPR